MDMYRKTYAARGLLEWQMALNAGGAILRICFSGGSMGANGLIPAKYTTDNIAIQKIIEDTPAFVHGKIFIYKQCKLNKDGKPAKENPKK